MELILDLTPLQSNISVPELDGDIQVMETMRQQFTVNEMELGAMMPILKHA